MLISINSVELLGLKYVAFFHNATRNNSQVLLNGDYASGDGPGSWPTKDCTHGWSYNFTDLFTTTVSDVSRKDFLLFSL